MTAELRINTVTVFSVVRLWGFDGAPLFNSSGNNIGDFGQMYRSEVEAGSNFLQVIFG